MNGIVKHSALAAGDDVEKLRKALAAEHAAVFAYGLLGARTTDSLRDLTGAAYDAHRAHRDQLRNLIIGRGGRPTESEPSYALPYVPTGAAQAARLAVQLENGVTAAYLELAAAADPALRKYAALAMQESATRAYAFQPAPPAAFPGMPGSTPPATPAPSRSGG
ncbi:ferritin-like domain-containing protein [Nonomuraea sp. NPDC001636]|uniref:ferritin-like domain-containing protein n=1 Tax=Nonomuraea sp. NPDC001636 TaxID=3154391 RepID=UPI003323816B